MNVRPPIDAAGALERWSLSLHSQVLVRERREPMIWHGRNRSLGLRVGQTWVVTQEGEGLDFEVGLRQRPRVPGQPLWKSLRALWAVYSTQIRGVGSSPRVWAQWRFVGRRPGIQSPFASLRARTQNRNANRTDYAFHGSSHNQRSDKVGGKWSLPRGSVP